MVAIGVLVIAVLGTIAAIAANANLRQTSRETEVMGQLLQHKLEEYRAIPNRSGAIARALADGSPAAFSFVMDLDGDGVIEASNANGKDEGAVKPSDLLPGATAQVFVLDEATASTSFATSNAAYVWDLDGNGTEKQAGVNADAGLPAGGGWIAGACDIDEYFIIPLRVVVTLPTVAGGGTDTRTLDAYTLLYYK